MLFVSFHRSFLFVILHPSLLFLCLCSFSEFSPSLSVTDLVCHGLLQESLRSLLGSIGSAKVGLQLLQWDSARATGIVCTNGDMSVGARAAWMLMGSYQGQTCRIDVQQQSLFLSALAT